MPETPNNARNGSSTTAFVLLLLSVTLVALVILNYRGFQGIHVRLDSLASAQGQVLADTIEGRSKAVASISTQHSDLLCMLALDPKERRVAVRSGDVCGFLLGGQKERR